MPIGDAATAFIRPGSSWRRAPRTRPAACCRPCFEVRRRSSRWSDSGPRILPGSGASTRVDGQGNRSSFNACRFPGGGPPAVSGGRIRLGGGDGGVSPEEGCDQAEGPPPNLHVRREPYADAPRGLAAPRSRLISIHKRRAPLPLDPPLSIPIHSYPRGVGGGSLHALPLTPLG